MGYWLMETEPHDYSWSQLVEDGLATWEGVHNVAVNSFETLRWQVHAATGSGASCAALTAAGVW